MHRLIKKSDMNIDRFLVPAMESTNSMIPLSALDDADVKNDRCPICHNNSLDRDEGFKICPGCGANFKIFNGHSYVIDTSNNGGIDILDASIKNLGLDRID